MMSVVSVVIAALFVGFALALVLTTLTVRWHVSIDLSPVEHAIVATAVQSGWGLATGDWWSGAAIGISIFIGREHAQAEYRYIAANGGSRYSTPLQPEIGCLQPRYWKVGDVLDLLMPVAACVIVAALVKTP
jgi:hypothetical protein